MSMSRTVALEKLNEAMKKHVPGTNHIIIISEDGLIPHEININNAWFDTWFDAETYVKSKHASLTAHNITHFTYINDCMRFEYNFQPDDWDWEG